MSDVMRWLPPLLSPIETDRLILRARQAEDAPASVRILTDPEVQRYFHGPLDPETAWRRARAAPSGRPGKFCVVLRVTGEPVGFVGVGPEKRRPGELGVSYLFLREHWGHGYAREAVPAVLAWVFNHVPDAELPRIIAVSAAANRRSRRLLEAVGMTHIDTVDEGHGQVVIYAIDRPTVTQPPCN